jgi:hypothetical protein
MLLKTSKLAPNTGGFPMRFVLAAAVAVLAVSIAAVSTVGPVAAQNNKAAAQKKAAVQKKAAGKMTYNQCVEIAYQRGFADSDMGGARTFIWRCMRGDQR